MHPAERSMQQIVQKLVVAQVLTDTEVQALDRMYDIAITACYAVRYLADSPKSFMQSVASTVPAEVTPLHPFFWEK